LDELGKLADEVDGLVLESSLGYQRYLGLADVLEEVFGVKGTERRS
jgi:hypothetical protein